MDLCKLPARGMNSHRLRLKIGEHEFEAEGSPEFVEHRFRAFEQLIRPPAAPPTPVALSPEQQIARIARVNRSVVYLMAKPPSVPDAALLVVLGHKTLRSKDAVSGLDVKRGLAASGVKLPRVDRLLAQLATDGYLSTSGKNRAKRYRLTDAGLARMRSIASAMMADVA